MTITQAQLREAIRSGEISAQEIAALVQEETGSKQYGYNLMSVLGILGAVICFTGLMILVGQHWVEFGSAMRVTLTLGSGLIAYVVAIILFLDEKRKSFSTILCALAVLLIPGGLGVTLHEAGYDLSYNSTQLFMSFVLFVTFAVPALILRSNLMLVAGLGALTALFFVSTNMLVAGVTYPDRYTFYQYRALFTGLFYVLLAYANNEDAFKPSREFLYFWGSAIALAAAYSLMGWKPDQKMIWELMYPCLAYGVIYGGVEFRSRMMTVSGVIALNAYIAKISIQYFAANLGWPLAMICTGMGIIAVALYSADMYRGETELAAADRTGQ